MANSNRLIMKPPPVPDPTEAAHQERIFLLAALHKAAYPELELLNHYPAGGYRAKATAAALQKQGVKAGYPDMFLPVPRWDGKRIVPGLYIELKRVKSGSLSEAQIWWLDKLSRQGYRAVMRRGADAAWQEILDYLALPAPSNEVCTDSVH